MLKRTNQLGAILAIIIYLLCILVFVSRLLNQPRMGFWAGVVLLLTGFPLIYLLFAAPEQPRSFLYYLQISLMLLYLGVQLLLEIIFTVNFRSTPWMVICYVMLFFAATGGMLGIAARAGRSWMLVSVSLYLIMAALAFIQRSVTGM